MNRQDYFDLMLGYASKSSKFDDVLDKKAEVIEDTINDIGASPDKILSVGFGPATLGLHKRGYDIDIVEGGNDPYRLGTGMEFLTGSLSEVTNKYSLVLALDEYTTYADSEDAQKDITNALCNVVGSTLITTVRDYKNMPPHKRNFEEPFNFFMDDDHSCLFLDHYLWDRLNKQQWNHYLLAIENHASLITVGPLRRHTMYFKQLAKFTKDAGAIDFIVNKNLLYKGLFKKTYEHIITIQF